MKALVLEHQVGDDGEDRQRDTFLNNFQLNQIERSAVTGKADAVGRNLTAVFEESDAPRESDNTNQGPVAGRASLLQFQMPIPGKCHEDIAQDEEQDRV